MLDPLYGVGPIRKKSSARELIPSIMLQLLRAMK